MAFLTPKSLILFCACCLILLFSAPFTNINAQEAVGNTATAGPSAPTPKLLVPPGPLSYAIDEPRPEQIPSLFFTREALLLIEDAIRGLNSGAASGEDNDKDPGIRELALGGIVFKANDDWTIWLNSRRITPDAIPSEIIDLKVRKEYIDIKWFDAYTNQIFPVRLRINERFNLDTRLFLSGTHSKTQEF